AARCAPLLRVLALGVVGLVRIRRGDPERWAPIEEAHALVTGFRELQYLVPVAVARAEAAWLEGRQADVGEATADVLEIAVARRASWVVGELTWLRRLAGISQLDASPAGTDVGGPYALALVG